MANIFGNKDVDNREMALNTIGSIPSLWCTVAKLYEFNVTALRKCYMLLGRSSQQEVTEQNSSKLCDVLQNYVNS